MTKLLSLSYLAERATLAWYYTLGVVGLQDSDVILTSFPRSGNTWLRFMFCNLISIEERGGREVTFPELDDTMPELGASNLLQPWPYANIPRVVKTHREYWPIFKRNTSILLIRDPRDVMTSFYSYKTDKQRYQYEGSFSDFIRERKYGLEAWAYHFSSWHEPTDHVLLYEDMKTDDIRAFVGVLDAIGIDVDLTSAEAAVRQSRFEKVQSVEDAVSEEEDYFQFEEGARFARKGKTGEWKNHFSMDDITYYHQVLERYEIRDCLPADYLP